MGFLKGPVLGNTYDSIPDEEYHQKDSDYEPKSKSAVKKKNRLIIKNWSIIPTADDIKEDYTLTDGFWELVCCKGLRKYLEKQTPPLRVRYSCENGNCVFTSILEGSGSTPPFKRISELKRNALDFFEKNEASITRHFKIRYPDSDVDTDTEKWSKEIRRTLATRVSGGTGVIIQIIAWLTKSDIRVFNPENGNLQVLSGYDAVIQPEPLSSRTIWMVLRIGDSYLYDVDFEPMQRLPDHASPIVPVSIGEMLTHKIKERLKSIMPEICPDCEVTSDIDYLLFECVFKNGVRLTLSSADKQACECILHPKSRLLHLLDPVGIAIKKEYIDQVEQLEHFNKVEQLNKAEQLNKVELSAEVEYNSISITDILKRPCTTRAGHYNDIEVKFFSLHDEDMVIHLVRAVISGRGNNSAAE